MVALLDHLHGVVPGHELLVEAELVERLAVRDLVRPPPLADLVQGAGEEALDVVDVVELGRPAVLGVDDDQLPVGLVLVDHADHAEHLGLADLAGREHAHADLAGVERVAVAGEAHVRVDVLGVLPGARQAAVVEPDVALAVLAELAVLGVLLDGVSHALRVDLELLTRGLGDLADEVAVVVDGLVLVVDGEERDVVPEGHLLAAVLGGLHLVVQAAAALHLLHPLLHAAVHGGVRASLLAQVVGLGVLLRGGAGRRGELGADPDGLLLRLSELDGHVGEPACTVGGHDDLAVPADLLEADVLLRPILLVEDADLVLDLVLPEARLGHLEEPRLAGGPPRVHRLGGLELDAALLVPRAHILVVTDDEDLLARLRLAVDVEVDEGEERHCLCVGQGGRGAAAEGCAELTLES
mmetsp:Transcript_92406/g.199794  ORF Transcript_92406/g.199794 Transcript_92406/m.199794 type:complete len:411 (-) Transcript_92406:25-1257(-)